MPRCHRECLRRESQAAAKSLIKLSESIRGKSPPNSLERVSSPLAGRAKHTSICQDGHRATHSSSGHGGRGALGLLPLPDLWANEVSQRAGGPSDAEEYGQRSKLRSCVPCPPLGGLSADRLTVTGEPEDSLHRKDEGYEPGEAGTARINATILSVVRNSEVDGMVQAMRDLERTWNSKFNYPWTFFNDEEFTEEFKTKTQAETKAKCSYGMEEWMSARMIERS